MWNANPTAVCGSKADWYGVDLPVRASPTEGNAISMRLNRATITKTRRETAG
jgi:hypothetical protein